MSASDRTPTNPDNTAERIALGALVAELTGEDYVTTEEAAAVLAWVREWASDCEWEDVSADDSQTMDAAPLLRYAHRYIDGGLAFVLADVRRCANDARQGIDRACPACAQGLSWGDTTAHTAGCPDAPEDDPVVSLGSDFYSPSRDYLRGVRRSELPAITRRLADDMLAESVDLWNLLAAQGVLRSTPGADLTAVESVQAILGKIASGELPSAVAVDPMQARADDLNTESHALAVVMERAEQDGYDAGVAAGSWVVDGNTSEDAARALLRGIEDGDPAVMDALPCSPLSGEYADGLLPRDVLESFDMEEGDDGADDVLRVFEDGYSRGVIDEVERSARAMLPDAEDEEPCDCGEVTSEDGYYVTHAPGEYPTCGDTAARREREYEAIHGTPEERAAEEARCDRPDLAPFVESTRYALTWDDVAARAAQGRPYPATPFADGVPPAFGAELPNGAYVVEARSNGDGSGVVLAFNAHRGEYVTWSLRLDTRDCFNGHYFHALADAVADYLARS